MVNISRSLFVLAMVTLLAGCFGKEFHLYTHSIAKSDWYQIKAIPKELFNGFYERISNYDGSSQGVLTLNTVKCGRFDLVADIDPNAECAADDDSQVIKMNEIVKVQNRLFVEAIVKTGLLSSRYALFEIVVTKDKFVLMPMIFNKNALMESGLSFSRSQRGDHTDYEVQNRAGQTQKLIEVMQPSYSHMEIHFKPQSEELNQRVRKLLKDNGIAEQQWPRPKPTSCQVTVTAVRDEAPLHSVRF